jgi:3-hydroxyacyl-[acyl-carrier-protein] dehydratase
MPRDLLVDLGRVDLNAVETSQEAIYSFLPQRGEFMLLDGIVALNVEERWIVAYKDIRPDDWWTAGHLPNRPLFPGVLQIEAAAQVVAYFTHVVVGTELFLGFVGVDKVKFRGAVVPPSRLLFIGRMTDMRPRRTIGTVQALVDDEIVFEGTITGMPV